MKNFLLKYARIVSVLCIVFALMCGAVSHADAVNDGDKPSYCM